MHQNEVIDWNPADGFAAQGDVILIPLPEGVAINTADEIKPVDGRLILQEGEVTGHHHAVAVDPDSGRNANFRSAGIAVADPYAGASPALQDRLAGKRRVQPRTGTARLFRDRAAADAMVSAGILARADLCVGFLRVEGGSITVKHEEHASIRVPAGTFYVGRQIESAGAEERVVQD